jgi:hypothetical protein
MFIASRFAALSLGGNPMVGLSSAAELRFVVDQDWVADREDAIVVLMRGQQQLGLSEAECRRLAESAAPKGWMTAV